jgi:hypothetical protein
MSAFPPPTPPSPPPPPRAARHSDAPGYLISFGILAVVLAVVMGIVPSDTGVSNATALLVGAIGAFLLLLGVILHSGNRS